MAVQSKTMSGARAILSISNVSNGTETVNKAGIFGNCSYGVTYDVAPVYILGRFNAGELVYTGMGTVDVGVSGFRVVDNGPYEIASVPQLQELLNHQDISLTLVDRQSGKQIMNVIHVRPTGFDSAVSAKGLHELNVSFTGITFMDESGNQEDTGAVDFG